jgi:hypothetical protein
VSELAISFWLLAFSYLQKILNVRQSQQPIAKNKKTILTAF